MTFLHDRIMRPRRARLRRWLHLHAHLWEPWGVIDYRREWRCARCRAHAIR